MLRYEIDPSDLDEENTDLIRLDLFILLKLLRLIDTHIKILEGARQDVDDLVLQQRFRVLVAMALQYGLTAGSIADRLGITVSTVHRWAKGKFVPPQTFIRAAAMRGIQTLLEQEVTSLNVKSDDESSTPTRYLPHLTSRYPDDGMPSASVVSFGQSRADSKS